MNDLRFAVRQLLKNPGFTAVAGLTLALCVGANVVIFAAVDSVLLRPLPFGEPDRLVTTINGYPKAGVPRSGSSLPNDYDHHGCLPHFGVHDTNCKSQIANRKSQIPSLIHNAAPPSDRLAPAVSSNSSRRSGSTSLFLTTPATHGLSILGTG